MTTMVAVVEVKTGDLLNEQLTQIISPDWPRVDDPVYFPTNCGHIQKLNYFENMEFLDKVLERGLGFPTHVQAERYDQLRIAAHKLAGQHNDGEG